MDDLARQFVCASLDYWQVLSDYQQLDTGDRYLEDRMDEALDGSASNQRRILRAIADLPDDRMIELVAAVLKLTAYVSDLAGAAHPEGNKALPRLPLISGSRGSNLLRAMAKLMTHPSRRDLHKMVESVDTYLYDLHAFGASLPGDPIRAAYRDLEVQDDEDWLTSDEDWF